MDRKAFLASLPFLPSAVKAALRKPERETFRLDVKAFEVPDYTMPRFNPQEYAGEFKWIKPYEEIHGMTIKSEIHGFFHGQA